MNAPVSWALEPDAGFDGRVEPIRPCKGGNLRRQGSNEAPVVYFHVMTSKPTILTCTVAARLLPNAGLFQWRFSTGNDLTDRDALPMFPAAHRLQLSVE